MFRKKLAIICLSILFVMLSFLFMFTPIAHAEDLTYTLNIITGVALTDGDGNPFGTDVSKDSDLLLTYTYEIPNGSVREGDTYSLLIPEEILIAVPGEFDLSDDMGRLIGTGILSTDGTLTITFAAYVDTYSNIHGSFWFDLEFNADNIGDDNPTLIVFEVGGTADPIVIEMEFEQPEPVLASVEKMGSYHAATRTITWQIVVDPGDEVLNNVVVTDTLASGLLFSDGSVSVGGVLADPSHYSFEAGMLTYNFPDLISTIQTITFDTIVEDSVFTTAPYEPSTTITNSANIKYDEGEVATEEATVTVPTALILKAGSYNSATKTITWTVTVNPMGVSIEDAMVLDTLPENLTLVTDSIRVDGEITALYDYNEATRALSYDFGDITQPHTLSFVTTVDGGAFVDNITKFFSNTVTLTSSSLTEEVDGTSSPVSVPSNIIQKQAGAAYNQQTAELTWRIIVNTNQIPLENCVITDHIPLGQQYVGGSAQITAGSVSGSFHYEDADPGDSIKTGSLTYTFDDTITDTYTITFKTKVTDPAVYANNVTNVLFGNTALLIADGISASSSATQNVTTRVINKTSSAYNYLTRRITWTITVNPYAMPLDIVVITDNIQPYMTYVEDSFTVGGSAPVSGFTYEASPGDPAKSGTLTYAFSDSIDSSVVITFMTEVTDLSIFATNGNKTARNTASLVHELLPGGASATANRSINNTVISKSAEYTPGNRYIDWNVTINTNNIPLVSGHITDQLLEGLALDTASVRLYHLNIAANGTLSLGDEVALVAGDFTYNADTRLFNFNIPGPIEGAYRLSFRTIVVDRTLSPFTNSVSFSGTGVAQTGTSGSISVNWAGSGSAGGGETGTITIHKIDSIDNSLLLEGAEFTLIDRFGFERKTLTDSYGNALFDMLLYDLPYTVIESSPPTGYLPNSDSYTFTIGSADEIKDITYQYENDPVLGIIEFYKYGYMNAPLSGAVFTLYDDEDNAIATATSGVSGLVVFEDVRYGTYTIRETTEPDGYFLFEGELTATVTEHLAVVTPTPDFVVNDPMLGSIRITKSDEDDLAPLAGCVFALYRADDSDFLYPLATAQTNEQGLAVFTDVPYGSYTIREILSPPGYLISDEIVYISITGHGEEADAGRLTNQKEPPQTESQQTELDRSPTTGTGIVFYLIIFFVSLIIFALLIVIDKIMRKRWLKGG